jgi:hypothetical protein
LGLFPIADNPLASPLQPPESQPPVSGANIAHIMELIGGEQMEAGDIIVGNIEFQVIMG